MISKRRSSSIAALFVYSQRFDIELRDSSQSAVLFMRMTLIIAASVICFLSAFSQQRKDYPRDLFNTSSAVSGTTPFPSYDSSRLGELYRKRHEIELQMFDIINEGALRHDPQLRRDIDLYGKDLGHIPLLAVAHYKYVFGDKSQLDWLLAEDKRSGLGRDSLILIVFGYMDEWDKTIRWFKQDAEGADGAASEVLHEAIEIRKRIYGAERFEKAWKAAKIR